MHSERCYIVVVLLSAAGAFFSNTPNSQPRECVGKDLPLVWTIQDDCCISTVLWFFKGTGFAAKSGINGAVTYTDSITATDVEHTSSGSIVIKNTNVADSGEYACRITYTGASGFTPASSTATVTVFTAPLDPTLTITGETYTCVSDSTSVTVTIKVDNVDKGTTTFTVSDDSRVECCLSGYAVQCREDTSGTEYCKVLQTVCTVWCIILVPIVILYGTSWIFAIVVVCVIYKEDQKRLPWNLCDGHLTKLWIWILLFILVPYVPSVVTIYLFKTKRSGKPTKPVISLKPVSVKVGDTATFTCTSNSTTYPAESGLTMIYTWRRNGVDIKLEGRYIVCGQTLTVTNVVKEDASDIFTCLAREDKGLTSDESDSARIVIIGKPTKPVISIKPVSVNVGGTANFTCTSSSTTVPAESRLTMIYTWRRNTVDMKSEGRYMVSGQTLTVTEVFKGDGSDTFTCLAREDKTLPSDESDSAIIVIIAKPTSGTKPDNYSESDQSIPLLTLNE